MTVDDPLDSAQIVAAAISAAGRGERWCLDGANAVRVDDLLVTAEADDLGWVLTAYTIDGDDAAPVAVLAGERADPVPALVGWLRSAAKKLRWKRIASGRYRAGDYEVGELATGEWFAEGPGVDRCFDHKSDAQAACVAAAETRRFAVS